MGRGSSKAGVSFGQIEKAKWSKYSDTQTGRRTTMRAGNARALIETSVDRTGEYFNVRLTKNGNTKVYGQMDLPAGLRSMDAVKSFAKRELKRM